MKIVATSDTHQVPAGKWGPGPVIGFAIPAGDVLIHAGDALSEGNQDEYGLFRLWMMTQPHARKIYVPGNHDKFVEHHHDFVVDDMLEFRCDVLGRFGDLVTTLPNGWRVGGLPYVTNLPRWAYNRTNQGITDYLEDIGYCDLIVAHSPPAGMLDGSHYGTTALRDYIFKYKPKLVICGHVHEGYGKLVINEHTTLYNVAMCDEEYEHKNPPVVIDIPD